MSDTQVKAIRAELAEERTTTAVYERRNKRLQTRLTELRKDAERQGTDYPTYETHLMKRCRHWDYCSADCPLDPLYQERGAEYEEQCTASRRHREGIVAEGKASGIVVKLRLGGRTEAEAAKDKRKAQGRAQWEALSEEERQAVIQRTARFRLKAGRGKGAGQATPSPAQEPNRP